MPRTGSIEERCDFGLDGQRLQRGPSVGREGAVCTVGLGRLRSSRFSVLSPITSSSVSSAPMVSDEDESLMRQVAAGDEAAFRQLAERHLGRIVRLAEKTLGQSAEADDVAQEALIRIWNNAANWRSDRSRLTTWIYTIVYRLCLDRLRKGRTSPLDEAMDVADPAADALDRMTDEEELHRLRAAVRSLEPRQRAALTLFYYEDYPGAEAAKVLGVSLRAFWSLLHRARQSLQTQMQSSVR